MRQSCLIDQSCSAKACGFCHGNTPVEEIIQTLQDLVTSGKIRYYALSDMPAWLAIKVGFTDTLASSEIRKMVFCGNSVLSWSEQKINYDVSNRFLELVKP